jgi:hypothetical protein
MLTLFRLLVCISLLLGCLIVLMYCPQIDDLVGLNLADLPGLMTHQAKIAQRRQELEQIQNRMNEHVAFKDKICRDAIAGRLALSEALILWRNVNQSCSHFWQRLREYGVGDTEEERLGRDFVDGLCLLLVDEGRELEAVWLRGQLDLELQLHLERVQAGGRLRTETANKK